jgi:carboxymethylenebutenolidase
MSDQAPLPLRTAADFPPEVLERAEAQKVRPTDARLHVERFDYPSPRGSGTARGYLVRPADDKPKHPGVLVIHENRGLTPHIEDVARRLALDGFVAFAPDALAPLGGYPGDEDQARELFAKLDPDKTREDFFAAARFLRARAEVAGPVGAVGFCWGGGLANVLATRLPPTELGAVVAFYGVAPPTPSVASIRVPVLLHYAEHDERINASRATYEAALKEARVRYEAHDYPGTQHGFHNDTTPRFDAAAAKLAWARTIAFFKRELH